MNSYSKRVIFFKGDQMVEHGINQKTKNNRWVSHSPNKTIKSRKSRLTCEDHFLCYHVGQNVDLL